MKSSESGFLYAEWEEWSEIARGRERGEKPWCEGKLWSCKTSLSPRGAVLRYIILIRRYFPEWKKCGKCADFPPSSCSWAVMVCRLCNWCKSSKTVGNQPGERKVLIALEIFRRKQWFISWIFPHLDFLLISGLSSSRAPLSSGLKRSPPCTVISTKYKQDNDTVRVRCSSTSSF